MWRTQEGDRVLTEAEWALFSVGLTLANYRSEMGRLTDELPQRWEAEVFAWFCEHRPDHYIANPDDQGCHAPARPSWRPCTT